MSEEKEIVKKDSKKELAQVTANAADWGMDDKRSSDLVIHYIKLVQTNSELVSDRKAQSGDLWIDKRQKVIADVTKTVKFIPASFIRQNSLFVFNSGSNRYEPHSVGPYPKEGLPYDDFYEGVPSRNYEQLTFFIHLKEDLDNGKVLPVRVSFRSSSLKAGRDLLTHMHSLLGEGRTPADLYLELGSKIVKKDNTYATYTVTPTDESVEDSYKVIAFKTSQMVKEKREELDKLQSEEEKSEARDVSNSDL